jgi:AcrR family transcriptional regulator
MDNKNQQTMEQSILEVAERLFLEKGFKLTSTTEIAKEVGCNQALVHYYFRTKENLFNIIFEQKFKYFFQEIFEMKNILKLSFLDKLKFIIESHFDLLLKNPRIPSLIIYELSRQPEQMTILREKLYTMPEQFFTELNSELQTEIEKGNVREINLIDLIINIISLNVAIFVMMPVIEKALALTDEQKELMIHHRKAQNVEFVLKSLRP